ISEVQETLDPKDSSGNGYGLAPIGHTVTVAGPTSKVINISMKVSTEVGLTYVDVTPAIQTALNDFFLNMRKQQWATIQNGRGYALTVFIAQISAAILGVRGVVNVSYLTLNNAANDIVLAFSNTLQEVPILGSVTVNG
ncbi:baseplate J/gp47 family protein, partial [Lactococcus lactis]|uniref:baseplate J/gp47 family protein n=1 Tax=Lactococcus lactis TaxID=1358 RepID=UPI00288DF42F